MTRQNDFLRHDYHFVPSSGDHYASLKQLRRSIDAQRQAGKRRADMYVYAEPPGPEGDTAQQGHPVFSNDQNVMIRGVHDAIAHLGGNHPFSCPRRVRGVQPAPEDAVQRPGRQSRQVPGGCGPFHRDRRADVSYYYVYGQFAPQKAVFLTDFDYYNVGLLAPSSRLNGFFVVQDKDLGCRPDFDARGLRTGVPVAVRRSLPGRSGGPKLRLAAIPGHP